MVPGRRPETKEQIRKNLAAARLRIKQLEDTLRDSDQAKLLSWVRWFAERLHAYHEHSVVAWEQCKNAECVAARRLITVTLEGIEAFKVIENVYTAALPADVDTRLFDLMCGQLTYDACSEKMECRLWSYFSFDEGDLFSQRPEIAYVRCKKMRLLMESV